MRKTSGFPAQKSSVSIVSGSNAAAVIFFIFVDAYHQRDEDQTLGSKVPYLKVQSAGFSL